MTTRKLSYLFSATVLSFAFMSAINCGSENTGTGASGTMVTGSSSSSSSSSSSGEGGSGGSGPCTKDSDCMSANQVCEQGACILDTCVNGMKDGAESDVDCGGGGCLPCGNDKVCASADDCASKFCNAMKCAACTAEADCAAVADTYCNAGTCTPKKVIAAACAADAECQSGFCPPQDGMCCNDRCDNTCEACAAAKTGGADGTCGPVTIDTDPDTECTDKGAATCGANGTGCNGDKSAPACKVYDNTAVCAAQSCTNGEVKAQSLCDGTGTCVAPTATSCSPYLCNATMTDCLTSCTTNAQCVNTHYCDTAMSKCVPKKTNGGTCSSGAQCASGFCPTQDGVCCDTACDTTCRACVQSKTGAASGTCANIVNGTDPDNECTQILAPNCNGAGQCG